MRHERPSASQELLQELAQVEDGLLNPLELKSYYRMAFFSLYLNSKVTRRWPFEPTETLMSFDIVKSHAIESLSL